MRGVLIGAALALLGLAGGCAQSAHESPASLLVRSNASGPDSLDPQKARTVQAQEILRDLCEGLTSLAKDGSVAAGSAQRWSVEEAGRLYRFELRPEARWSNGDPLVAADFVAGLRRLVDPATASPYAEVVDIIVNARAIIAGHAPVASLGVSAPDAHTVTVRLEAPAPYLPALLAHPSTCPVHGASTAPQGAAFSSAGSFVSNGAYDLEEWVPGSHVLIRRNHHYWNDAATHIETVKWLEVAGDNAELTRYRAGEIDVTAVVPRNQLDWIRAHIPRELHISPQLTTYFYGFNLDREPFRGDPRLRRALSMVIDRERLASSVLRAGELPAYGWVPPGIHDYGAQSFDYRTLPLQQRILQARRLIAQSGYTAGRPLSFELRYSSDEISAQLAVAIASMWQQSLPVQVRLVAEDFKSLLGDIERRDVDVFRSSWAADYNDAYTFAQYLKSDFGVNLPHYRSADYDALLSQAAAAEDLAHRRTLLEEAERVALRDHPLIPIYFYVNKHLVKPRVHGWYDNVLNVVYSKDLWLQAAPP
ncbi:MAG TPA: peptide ABC transporter substrate-binding protein [Steroidobacteraceae bacterium]|nr:peptide ABC transporter substrate-binding protein [Steroidobacteraceae bacterium]